jgi:hypothetical protein
VPAVGFSADFDKKKSNVAGNDVTETNVGSRPQSTAQQCRRQELREGAANGTCRKADRGAERRDQRSREHYGDRTPPGEQRIESLASVFAIADPVPMPSQELVADRSSYAI